MDGSIIVKQGERRKDMPFLVCVLHVNGAPELWGWTNSQAIAKSLFRVRFNEVTNHWRKV